MQNECDKSFTSADELSKQIFKEKDKAKNNYEQTNDKIISAQQDGAYSNVQIMNAERRK